jgi:transcriptional regulator with XRE-family HTH domain
MFVGSKEFGALVREARLRRGWQQQDVADRIGVDRGYISVIENGKRNWPQQYIAPLASVLGISQVEMAIAAGLIEREGPVPERDPHDPVEILCANVRQLTPDELPVVATYVEFLIESRGRKLQTAPTILRSPVLPQPSSGTRRDR